jgi:hypothetical protein
MEDGGTRRTGIAASDLGGLGFAAHVLWYVLVIAVPLWLIGFSVGGAPRGGGRKRLVPKMAIHPTPTEVYGADKEPRCKHRIPPWGGGTTPHKLVFPSRKA